MPKSWQKSLANVSSEKLSNLLNGNFGNSFNVWPLSMLALQKLIQKLSITRTPQPIDVSKVRFFRLYLRFSELHLYLLIFQQNDLNSNPRSGKNQKLQTILCKKNIKLKKRHEIEMMSQLTASIAKECNVNYIVDFGSGLGHLARSLSFNHGLNVCCLEQQSALIGQASYAHWAD